MLTNIAIRILIVLNVIGISLKPMGVGISSMVFASNTIPTDFGLVLAAIAGAGSLLLIALRFVPEAKN